MERALSDDVVVDPQLVEEWEALAERTGASPFLRPAWVVAHHRAFSSRTSFDPLTVWREGSLAGILPLFNRRGCLVSYDGYDTEAGPVAADLDAHRELAARLLERRCAVDLRSVPAESPWLDVLPAAARDARALLHVEPHRTSLHVDVAGTWADLEQGTGRSRRQHARRRWRRLAEQGSLVVEEHDGRERLEELLDEGFRVEGSGWKGTAGTSVDAAPGQRRFYDELARATVATGALRLWFLRLDGRPLAFCYDIVGGRTQYHLKGGFDEEFAEHSPGILLRLRIVERLCADPGIDRYDLLGRPDGGKEQVATGGRERVRLRLHPPGLVGVARHATRLAAARARVEAERVLPEPAWERVHQTIRRVRRAV